MKKLLTAIVLAILLIALTAGLAPPAFAAATCYDGTTSESSGSGTCSHHGGVYEWIY